jgi:hypothetical protein
VVIGKVRCARAAGRYERDRVCPVAGGSAWICIGRRSGDCPFLEIGADVLILNDNGFSLSKQRQENVNIFVVVRQMADVDAGRANLRGVVPRNMSVPWIPRRGSCVSLIQEKA